MRHAYLDAPTPLAIAHRGGAEEAPENTMPAFAAAIALGYRYLETDVHLTRDGALVAFHDDVLDRVTDRPGRIAELDLATINRADAGAHFTTDGGATHPFRGAGVNVPTLEQLLTEWPQVRVNIDPKADAAVAPLVRVIGGLKAWDRVCIGAYSESRLTRIRQLSENRACTSMGPRSIVLARIASLAGWMPTGGADCIQVPVSSHGVRVVDRRFLASAHRRNLQVHVWTVSDEGEMDRLLDLGVDGLMTDAPRLLRAVLERRGQWHRTTSSDDGPLTKAR